MSTTTVDPLNFMTQETGRILEEFNTRRLLKARWTGLFDSAKIPFPTKMGEVISEMMFESPYVDWYSASGVQSKWQRMYLSPDQDGNNPSADPADSWDGTNPIPGATTPFTGEPNVVTPRFTQNTRTFYLEHLAFNSPQFLCTDFLFTLAGAQQLASITQGMGDIVSEAWGKWFEGGLSRLGRRIVANSSLSEVNYDETQQDNETFPAYAPTSILVPSILDNIYDDLDLEGAGEYARATGEDGMPMFEMICSKYTARALRTADDTVRQDYREMGETSSFYAPLGAANKAMCGFIPVVNPIIPRYTFADGVFTRVPEMVRVSFKGKWRMVKNPDYMQAPYEKVFFIVPGAMNVLVPPIVGAVGAANFATQNFVGDLQFLNIPNADPDAGEFYNPTGKKGFLHAELAAGLKGTRPFHIITMMVQNPGVTLDLINKEA